MTCKICGWSGGLSADNCSHNMLNAWRCPCCHNTDGLDATVISDRARKPVNYSAFSDKYTVPRCEIFIGRTPIKRVIYAPPATIVFWNDGTKTVVKCDPNDTYDKEKGLLLCMVKRALGNKSNYNNILRKWLEDGTDEMPVQN